MSITIAHDASRVILRLSAAGRAKGAEVKLSADEARALAAALSRHADAAEPQPARILLDPNLHCQAARRKDGAIVLNSRRVSDPSYFLVRLQSRRPA